MQCSKLRALLGARSVLTAHQPYRAYLRVGLVTSHGHRQQQGSPLVRVVTGRMLEQLTYAQIGERLNVSSEGARAIVKRNRLRARTATMAEPWLRSTSTSCGTNPCPHGHRAASQ